MWHSDRPINVACLACVTAGSHLTGGNYTLGLTEQLIFPEIQYDKIDKVRGMEISIVTTAETDDHARQLLSKFGMPFRKGN